MKLVGLVCLSLGALMATAPAAAQEGGADPLAELRACRDIAEDGARLACYDRQAGVLLTAEESGEITFVDRERAEETRKGLFGFSGVKVPFFEDGDEVDQVESTITQVRRYGRNNWLITIEEGSAVWRIEDPPMRFNAPRVGDQVSIRRGSLTSYFIRVRTQLGVKGRRVE